MESDMNPQVMSTMRYILGYAGVAVVARGWADEGTVQMVIGGIMSAAPVLLSIWSRRPAGIIAEAAKLGEGLNPAVHKIVASKEIANSPQFLANPVVVAPHGF